ncbi:hypothetical protein F4823DRAFT_559913 [Ustulina deusta]|nr:hypothetical protein F4823DRAFT_559913 [Ustulina deusta]
MTSPVVYRCSLANHAILVQNMSCDHNPQNLQIDFRRTIRVPDNLGAGPPLFDRGNFPLFKTRDFASELPSDKAMRCGVFFPMYQREAMWIMFVSDSPFMIKIYADGVNVVSGEHNLETAATKRRRLALASKRKNIQDYVVVPRQPWLFGCAVSPRVLRQFETVGGLQFEITPSMPQKRTICPCTPSGNFSIRVKRITPPLRIIRIPCSRTDTIENVKESVARLEGITSDQLRLSYPGEDLEDGRTLMDYDVENNGVIEMLVARKNYDWPGPIGVEADRTVKQVILEDNEDPSAWVRTSTITIPVHILTTRLFRDIAGQHPPRCPVLARSYARAGLPFFEFPEKASGISGTFADDEAKSVNPRAVTIDPKTIDDPDGLVNPDGPLRAFRTLKDLRDELELEDESTVDT